MSRGVDGDHLYRSVSPSPPTGDTSRPPTSLDVGAARARLCGVDGCEKRHFALGLCTTHYQRWRSHGDPRASIPIAFGGPATPLTCQCVFPNVGRNDECVRCYRVIAEHVHRRRAAR